MATKRPHILLISTDQQRGDHLGIEGHPVLQTPNLDHIGRSGAHFRRAYSECPSCVPARRTLLSGQSPEANGMVGYQDGVEWDPAYTLPGELSAAGYQTELIGKLHLHPYRKRYGFQHMHWADASRAWGHGTNDYTDWLVRAGAPIDERGRGLDGDAHGVTANGWVGRPNVLPEHLTHSYWCASQAIDFFHRRDPSSPFFLYLSFIDPHPPLTPPQFHYDRYVAEQLPLPVVGDWVEPMQPTRGLSPDASVVSLDRHTMHYARAAYCGLINHVDDQIGRVLRYLANAGLLQDTLILFTSDHGEMLGDHHLFRKCYAFEASARVPFLLKAPNWMKLTPGATINRPVGLQDVMPTLLEAAGSPIPGTVTGRSVLPLLREGPASWREFLHGEHSPCYRTEDGNHFVTDGRFKYIWFSQTGRELLFDLGHDPNEMKNLAKSHDIGPWRDRLIGVLRGRPEGFTDGTRLIAGRPHGNLVPGR